MSDENDKTTKAIFIPEEVCETHKTMGGTLIKQDGSVTKAIARFVEDGQPIMGDHVTLTPRADGRPAYDAEITPIASAHKGPARVTSDAYRLGWDRIFGNKEVGEA